MKNNPPFTETGRILVLLLLTMTACLAQVPIGTSIYNAAECTYRDPGGFRYHLTSDTVETVVSGGYQLLIEKHVNNSIVIPGDTVEYQIILSNTGNDSAQDITVTDSLSPGLIYLTSDPPAETLGNSVNRNIPLIQAGEISVLNLWCKIDDLDFGEQIENYASYHTADGNSGESVPVMVEIGQIPEIEISLSVDRNVALPGDTLCYTISVQNTGNTVSTNTIIYDNISDYSSIISVTDDGFESNGIITWNIGDLSIGDTVSQTMMVRLKSDIPQATDMVNYASAVNAEGCQVNASVITQINPSGANLEISKTAVYSEYTIDDTIEYLITLRNTSNSMIHNALVVDTLPDQLAYLDATHGGVLIDDIVIWDIGTLQPYSRDTLTVSTTIESPVENNPEITNRVYARISNTTISQAAFTVNVRTLPDLKLTKSTDPRTMPGDTLNYILSYSNDGTAEATSVIITDSLANNLVFINTTGSGTYNPVDHSVSWDIGTLEAGISDDISLVTRVVSPLLSGTEIINRARIACNENIADQSETTTLVRTPTLTLTKSADSSIVVAGSNMTYTLTFNNTGDTVATGVVIQDTLPQLVQYVSSSGNSVYNPESHAVVWEIDDIAPTLASIKQGTGLGNIKTRGEFKGTEQVVVWIDSTISLGTELINSATISSHEGINASSTVRSTVIPAPELTLSKQAPASTIAGDTLEYLIRYSNIGSTPATQVMITDSLSTDLVFISASGPNTYNPSNHTVRWDIGDLGTGISGDLILTVLVQHSATNGNEIHNKAILTCNEGKTVEADEVTSFKAPVIQLSKIAESENVDAGSIFKYTILIENTGDTSATGIVLIDSLAENISYVSSTGSSVYDEEAHTVTWEIAELLSADSRTIGIKNKGAKKTGNPTQTGNQKSITEELVVRVNAPIPDNTPLWNGIKLVCNEDVEAAAETTVIIQSAPAFSFVKQAQIEVLPGDTLEYMISYTNIGTDDATGVVIRDSLPPELTFIHATEEYSYNTVDHTVNWDIGTLQPGSTGTVNIVTGVSAMLENGAQIINSSSIHSNEGISDHKTALTTNILPINLELSSNPRQILGNGSASSLLTAAVKSFLGNPAPDGIPVSFASDIGTIPEGADTSTTLDGFAYSTIVSDTVANEPHTATIYARANYSITQYATDTTQVEFVIGAFDGTIYNYSGVPIHGAIVELINLSTGLIVGTDTTGVDGYYIIPVSLTDDYSIQYTITDEFGNTTTTVQDITTEVPSNGQIITNLNSLSGYLYDQNTGDIITDEGIPVILISASDSTAAAKSMLETQADTAYTDATGLYFFTNLATGLYQVKVIYNGIHSYSDGLLGVNLATPGQYVVNANIALAQSPFFAYKTVDHHFAEFGDTLTYTIKYGSNNVSLPDSVYLYDSLPEEVILIEESLQLSQDLFLDNYDQATNIIQFHRQGILAGQEDSVKFKVKVTGNINSAVTSITNQAYITNHQDTTFTGRDSRSSATTKIVLAYLSVKKEVNRRVAETGDVLTYQIIIENKNDELALQNIKVQDLLPQGFRYQTGRSYWEGNKINNPVQDNISSRIQLTWNLNDTIYPGQKRTLKYRTIAGLLVRYGENENIVYATAETENNIVIQSRQAQAKVVIKPGIMSDRGLIFGKIYYDLNQNNLHDKNEPVQAGVELITESGIRVITDQYGKYSIPSIQAGEHVIRINRRTLPGDAKILLNSADFFGDPLSRWVKVSHGGIAKANFVLAREGQIALSRSATINMEKEAITDEFRLLVYKPWGLTIRLGFLSGEAVLRPEIYSELSKVADFLLWQTEVHIEINGHTDNIPPPSDSEYPTNLLLSENRTLSIKEFLVDEMGIDISRIKTAGYGDLHPVAENDTPEGRAQNRRVDIIFHTPEEEQPQYNQLRFQYNINYSGGIPLSETKFHEILPPGFRYAQNSSYFSGLPYEPAEINQQEIVWFFGTQTEKQSSLFEFGIEPAEVDRIENISTAKNYVSYLHPQGHNINTDSLITNISTLVEELSYKLVVEGTQFDVSSDILKSTALPNLSKLGEFMEWQEGLSLVIEGFTDDQGNIDFNRELSRRRAESVKNYLTEQYSISPDRIQTRGLGHHYPIADNTTPEGRGLNRRVEILVNSSVTEQASLDIEVVEGSFNHVVQVPLDPFDPQHEDKILLLNANTTSNISIHYIADGLPECDQIRMTMTTSEGIMISDLTDLDPMDARFWDLDILPDQLEIRHDFLLITEPGISGMQRIILTVQPYFENKRVGAFIEKSLELKIE